MLIAIVVGAYLLVFCWVIRTVLTSRDPDWPMAWVVLHFINFPLSLVLRRLAAMVSTWLRHQDSHDVDENRWQSANKFWIPLILYGLFGLIWWAGLAWTASLVVR